MKTGAYVRPTYEENDKIFRCTREYCKGKKKYPVEFTVAVPEGSTILDACRSVGIDTPTLCYGETLRPANVCRVCVVELEGARALAPACSRLVEPGMKVRTDSERVRHSRRPPSSTLRARSMYAAWCVWMPKSIIAVSVPSVEWL